MAAPYGAAPALFPHGSQLRLLPRIEVVIELTECID
jgi:hypothetical protein